MKIIFTENERDSLPEDAREKLGDDLEIEVASLSELSEEFESVGGLKSALSKEREDRRKAEKDLKATSARLTIAEQESGPDAEALAEKDAEIERMKTDHAMALATRDTEITTLKDQATNGSIAAAVSKANGNVALLTPHLRAALSENPELDLDEHIAGMKSSNDFAGAFKASEHSGSGGLDAGPRTTFGKSRIGSMPTRRSEMTDRQKVDYQKEKGLDALMDLPQ